MQLSTYIGMIVLKAHFHLRRFEDKNIIFENFFFCFSLNKSFLCSWTLVLRSTSARCWMCGWSSTLPKRRNSSSWNFRFLESDTMPGWPTPSARSGRTTWCPSGWGETLRKPDLPFRSSELQSTWSRDSILAESLPRREKRTTLRCSTIPPTQPTFRESTRTTGVAPCRWRKSDLGWPLRVLFRFGGGAVGFVPSSSSGWRVGKRVGAWLDGEGLTIVGRQSEIGDVGDERRRARRVWRGRLEGELDFLAE